MTCLLNLHLDCSGTWDSHRMSPPRPPCGKKKQKIKLILSSVKPFAASQTLSFGPLSCSVFVVVLHPPKTKTSGRVNVGYGDAGPTRGKKGREGGQTGRGQAEFVPAPALKAPSAARPPAYVCILIRSNVCLLERRRGRLSVLLFPSPSFYFPLKTLPWLDECPSWVHPHVLCM